MSTPTPVLAAHLGDPLLFILYINDFSRSSDLLFSILFADDTTVIIEGINYKDIINNLNIELKKVDSWLSANKLTINILLNALHDVSPYKN